MAWVAVNENGSEYLYEDIPCRSGAWWFFIKYDEDTGIELPKGSIEKLIGKKLTWKDEPIELK